MSARETTPKGAAYFIDNIEGGARNLNALISVICDIRYDLPDGQDDPRVDGLLWIARDLADGLVDCYERGLHEGKGGAS